MNRFFSYKLICISILTILVLGLHGQAPSIAELLNQGRSKLDAGDYQEAIVLYQDALKINNQDPEIHHELALAFYRIGNYPLASRHMNRSLEYGFGTLLEANLLNLLIIEKTKNTKTTRKAYERAMVRFPGTSSLMLQYGIYLANNDHGPKSIDILSKAVILDPLFPQAHFQLGLQCMKSRQYLSAYYAFVYYLLVHSDTIPAETLEIIHQNASNLREGFQSGNPHQKTLHAHDPLFALVPTHTASTVSTGHTPVLDNPALYQIDPSKVDEQSAWSKVYFPFFRNLYAHNHLDALIHVIDRKSGNPSPSVIDPEKIVSFADWLEMQWSSQEE